MSGNDSDDAIRYYRRIREATGDFTTADLLRGADELDMPINQLSNDLQEFGLIKIGIDELCRGGFNLRQACKRLKIRTLER